MNNKISNEKVPVEGGIELNDKDYINEILYSKYKTMFDEYSSLQREIYEIMFRFGWYELEKSDNNKINEKYTMLNQEFTKLS